MEQQAPQAERFAVGLIVNNHFGVLNRISGLYAKRCYNIDALSVGETADPRYSRMTIVSTGDEYMKDQVVHQLEKLIDVLSVTLLAPDETAFAQHMFIKIRLPKEGVPPERAAPVSDACVGKACEGKTTGEQPVSAEGSRRYLLALISRYRGRVIDFGAAHLTAELTGTAAEIEAFIEAARPYGILEVSRSGDIAIGLGLENTLYVNQPTEA